MKVTVLSQDALMREGILCLLAHQSMFRIAGGIETVAVVGEILKDHSPNILLVDGASLSAKDWSAVKEAIKGTKVKVVAAISSDAKSPDAADITFTRTSGAGGMMQALRQAVGDTGLVVREATPYYGTYPRMLTPREFEVAQLIAQGMPNRKISQNLGLREQSIKNLVSTVMRKLDCENRVQVALRLTQKGK